MSKDPAFLFYPNDYVGGTMGMTFEEKGAYIELLMLQFNRGHMTSQMIGQTVGQLWDKIQDKFIKDDQGLYYNVRLEIEKKKRQGFVKSRHNNLSGNNQYTKKEGHIKGHMTSRMENKDVNENNNIRKGVGKKKPFIKPSLVEVEEYFVANGYKKEIGKKAWMGYDTANWFDSKGSPILNWKQKMINVWFKEEHKINNSIVPEFYSGSDK